MHRTEITHFFWAKYKTYSRIDYILSSQNIITSLIEALIGSITLSDHAPTSCTLEMGEAESREWHWKINETLLKESEYEGKLKQELDYFFIINDTGETTPFCIWETHECVMRGIFIAMGAHRKRKLN